MLTSTAKIDAAVAAKHATAASATTSLLAIALNHHTARNAAAVAQARSSDEPTTDSLMDNVKMTGPPT